MKKEWTLPISLAAILLLSHIIYFASKGNYEFLGYSAVIVALFTFLILTDKTYNYPTISIWLISIWVAVHSFGGSIYINGIRLFDIIIIPIIGDSFQILKYDQIAHTFSYFTIAIFAYYILKKYIPKGPALFTATIITTSGVGAIYEIIEFAMVVFFDAGEAVGGYYNTALDLCFNLIGATLGTFFASKL